MLSLMTVITMVGSLVLLSCPGDNNHDNPATASDLSNRSFTFASGSAFNPALANVPTVLSFPNNAANFAVQATVQNVVRTATGPYVSESCTLTVGSSTDPTAPAGGSNFPAGTGPQPNAAIDLTICDFDSTNNSLTVFDGTTATAITGVSRTVH
jgi:hypothetical protein